jgi:CubicO group peptidase (beta-lactamase class C family)
LDADRGSTPRALQEDPLDRRRGGALGYQGARFRRDHGMPADAFMALGIYGQTIVVVPSERLVITRFGTTYDLRMAMIDICRLTADTIAALHAPVAEAPRTTRPR